MDADTAQHHFTPWSTSFRRTTEILNTSLNHICRYLALATPQTTAICPDDHTRALQQSVDKLVDGWMHEYDAFNERLALLAKSETVPKSVRRLVSAKAPLLLDEFHRELRMYRQTHLEATGLRQGWYPQPKIRHGLFWKLTNDHPQAPRCLRLEQGHLAQYDDGSTTYINDTHIVQPAVLTHLQLYIVAVAVQSTGLGLCKLSRAVQQLCLCEGKPNAANGDDKAYSVVEETVPEVHINVATGERTSESSEAAQASRSRVTEGAQYAAMLPEDLEDRNHHSAEGSDCFRLLAAWEHRLLCHTVPALAAALSEELGEKTPVLAGALGRDLHADPQSLHAGVEAMILRNRMSGALSSATAGKAEDRLLAAGDIRRTFDFWRHTYRMGLTTKGTALRHFRNIILLAADAILIGRPNWPLALQTADSQLPPGWLFFGPDIFSPQKTLLQKPQLVRQGSEGSSQDDLDIILRDCRTLIDEIERNIYPKQLHCTEGNLHVVFTATRKLQPQGTEEIKETKGRPSTWMWLWQHVRTSRRQPSAVSARSGDEPVANKDDSCTGETPGVRNE